MAQTDCSAQITQGGTLANGEQAPGVIYKLDSQRPNPKGGVDYESCSAAAVKIAGQCVLLTNSHCMLSEEGFLSLPTVSAGEAPMKTRVLKRDSVLDIVQLSFPSMADDLDMTDAQKAQLDPSLLHKLQITGSETEYCGCLRDNPASASIPDPQAFATMGYQTKNLRMNFTNEIPWLGDSTNKGISKVSAYPLSLDSKDILWQITNIDLNPGESGGFLIDGNAHFIGLQVQYIPFESIAYVIPITSIQNFLESPQTLRALPTNANGNTLSNLTRQSGNNSHGDSGNNSHGDSGSAGLGSTDPRISAQEPAEGIALPGDPNMILLGIGQQSIDGTDDLYKFYRPNIPASKLILRPKDGFPDISIRKQIFSRLAGHYKVSGAAADTTYDFLRDTSQITGWQRVGSGHSSDLEISIDPKKLTISMKNNEFQDTLNNGQSGTAPPLDLELQAKFNSDSSQLELTGSNQLLPKSQRPTIQFQCKNDNYLKLICSAGDTYILSFYLSNIKEGTLGYRLGVLNTTIDQPLFTLRFGELRRAP